MAGNRNSKHQADFNEGAHRTFTEIVTALKEVGTTLRMSLTENAVSALIDDFTADNIKLPDDYIVFLRQMNGFFYPGVVFFGRVYDTDSERHDILAVNRDMRVDYPTEMQDRVLIGESFSYLFVYNWATKNYERLFSNFRIDQRFADLGELLKSTLSLSRLLERDTTMGLRPHEPPLQ